MKALLSPRSIALIGVSSDTEKISGRLLPILQAYNYAGRIYPINPKRTEIQGLKCYPNLLELPETPDVAVVLVPNSAVPGVLRQAVAKRVRYVMVYSSGFNETSGEGQQIAKEVQEILRGTQTRLIGPNSEGFYDLASSVALSFSPVVDPSRGRSRLTRGGTVVISQSGGLGFAIADQLEAAGTGIRAVVTTGNELDVEVADFIRFYAVEPDVERIVLFVEGAKDLVAWEGAFLEARAQGKTILAIQIGSSPAGTRAVSAHTGKSPRTAGAIEKVFEATGVLKFDDIDDLVDAAIGQSQGRGEQSGGNRLAIVSASGGGGIWTADLAEEHGLSVAPPSPGITEKLRSILPGYASLLNPIDVTAQAIFDGSIAPALAVMLTSGEFDGVLIVGTFGYDHKLIHDAAFQKALQEASAPVVVFSYTPPSREAKALLQSLNVPCFTSPRRAVRALAAAIGRTVPGSTGEARSEVSANHTERIEEADQR